jgi:hypothetical protein
MNKDNLLLSSDYDENNNQYWYIYDYTTLDIVKQFDNEIEANTYFNELMQ